MRTAFAFFILFSIACFGCSKKKDGAASIVRYWDLPTGSHIAYVKFVSNDSSESTPLIFLHGGPGGYEVSSIEKSDGKQWYKKLAEMGFDVYFYDQIGGGLSARLDDPSGYTVARHVADLECIRMRAGNKQCVIIAGSWGATLASHYIAAYPGNVLKAVFISPKNIDYRDLDDQQKHFQSLSDVLMVDLPRLEKRFGGNKFNRYVELLHLMQTDIRQAHAYAGDEEMDEFADAMFSANTLEHYVHDRNLLNTPGMSTHGMGWWAFVMTGWDAFKGAPVKDALRSIQTPALILRGESDIIPAEVAKEYASVYPNSRLVTIPACGHFLSLEQPEILAHEIEAFLAKPPKQRGK